MNGRVIHGMSNAEYHALPDLGNSGLSALAKSPAHYHALYLAEDRPERITSDAFSAGTLAHCAILEPLALSQRYAVRPDGIDLRTKEGKAWAAALDPSLEVITGYQMTTAMRQAAAVLAVPALSELFSTGRAEVSAFWTDPRTGVQCKCRPDWVHGQRDGSVILVDVKTARDATPDGFARAIAQYGYHRQAAWYSRGYEAASGRRVHAFVFAVVPSEYPFIASACVLDEESMQQGADECDELVSVYAECTKSNTWPGHGSGFQQVSLPVWAKRSQEVEVSYAG